MENILLWNNTKVYILEYSDEIELLFNFKKPDILLWWNYIELDYIKEIIIYLENTELLIKRLSKIHVWKDEEFLMKTFFTFLVDLIIDRNNSHFLAPSQKILFEDFEIDLFIDDYYFLFEIFDENKKKELSEDEKYNTLLKRKPVKTKSFVYNKKHL